MWRLAGWSRRPPNTVRASDSGLTGCLKSAHVAAAEELPLGEALRRTAAGHSPKEEAADVAADEAVSRAMGGRAPPTPSLDVHWGVQGLQLLHPRDGRPERPPAHQASPLSSGRTGMGSVGRIPRLLSRGGPLRSSPTSAGRARMAFRQQGYGRSFATR